MTEAERAAFRILMATPRERIHRHEWKPIIARKGGRTSVEQTRRLNRLIMDLREKGWNQTRIAAELLISKVTVSRHCRGAVRTLCQKNNKDSP